MSTPRESVGAARKASALSRNGVERPNIAMRTPADDAGNAIGISAPAQPKPPSTRTTPLKRRTIEKVSNSVPYKPAVAKKTGPQRALHARGHLRSLRGHSVSQTDAWASEAVEICVTTTTNASQGGSARECLVAGERGTPMNSRAGSSPFVPVRPSSASDSGHRAQASAGDFPQIDNFRQASFYGHGSLRPASANGLAKPRNETHQLETSQPAPLPPWHPFAAEQRKPPVPVFRCRERPRSAGRADPVRSMSKDPWTEADPFQSQADRLAQHAYSSYVLRGLQAPDEPTSAAGQDEWLAVLMKLPPSLRPPAAAVKAEAHASGMPLAKAAAVCLVGHDLVRRILNWQAAAGQDALSAGHLDLKAWLRHTYGGSASAEVISRTDVLFASVVLLHNPRVIAAVDASAMQSLSVVPAGLRILPGLRALIFNGCKQLHCIAALRACAELKAIDLSNCSSLVDLQPLSKLTELEVVDLSGCVALTDVGPLRADAAPIMDNSALGDLVAPERRSCGTGALPSTSKLRWLSLSGCVRLEFGTAGLAHCQYLAYVDLFECTSIAASDCLAIATAAPVRTCIWPCVSAISIMSQQSESSPQRSSVIQDSARSSAREKWTLAANGERAAGLPRLHGAAQEAVLESANRAVREFCGLEEEERRSESKEVGLHMPPLVFVRGLRVLKFQCPDGVDLGDLFKMLATGANGTLTASDLGKLRKAAPAGADADWTIRLLMKRHQNDCSAAAADLARSRATLDHRRIKECFVIAGAEESTLDQIAITLEHCAAGVLAPGSAGDAEGALAHALSGYAVAWAASMVEDFKDLVYSDFGGPSGAFQAVDVTSEGAIGWTEFQGRTAEVLKWCHADTPGACEAVFQVLDSDGSGGLTAATFKALETFEVAKAMRCMLAVGRQLRQFPGQNRLWGGGAAAERGPPSQPLFREDFAAFWDHAMRTCADRIESNVAFGLLDINGQNFLGPSELLMLSDALPRRAQAAAAGELELFLRARFGASTTTEKWFDGLLRAGAPQPASPTGKKGPKKVAFADW